MMKVAYFTAQAPYGRGETFIVDEMLAIKEAGIDLLIIPRNPIKKVFHQEAQSLLSDTIWLSLLSFKIIYIFLISLIIKPYLLNILISVIRASRNFKILFKNLAVMPKSVFIANFLQAKGITHIHAHWGSTTATMAYIVSRLSGIPWSVTLHRWDIKENNMLKEKIKLVKFVRCISEDGKTELSKIIGTGFEDKIKVIHMGVKIPSNVGEIYESKKYFKIITPANLLPVKGHKYLIEACSILIKKNIKNFKCFFYGEGLGRKELEDLINRKSLKNYIEMPGLIPHEKLIHIYKNNKVAIVVLPSITTEEGAHEGIPVALMEAMAYSIPVISTNTGGIPELLSKDAGIIIEEKKSEKLAMVIIKLIEDKSLREKIGRQGYNRVCEEFNIQKNTRKLLELFGYKYI